MLRKSDVIAEAYLRCSTHLEIEAGLSDALISSTLGRYAEAVKTRPPTDLFDSVDT